MVYVSNAGQLLALCSIMVVGQAHDKAMRGQQAYSGSGFLFHSTSAKLIWLPSVWLLVGGGLRVEMAMQYTALCDVTSREQR